MTGTLTAAQLERIKELSERKNLGVATTLFDAALGKTGKYWFCRRLAMNALDDNNSLSLDALQTAIDEKIARASVLIEEWRNAFQPAEPPGLGNASKKERFKHRLRAIQQVVVCGMAIHPRLGLGTNADLFKRIGGQRLRMWERMRFDINPSGHFAAFDYSSGATSSLNDVADDYWVRAPVAGSDQWTLNQYGRDNAKDAISSLFLKRRRNACNLTFCQHAATSVLLDSLLSPDVARTYDFSGLGGFPGYFFIDTPYKDPVSTHFLNDGSAYGRFERTRVILDDLQIGDHVFADSHVYYGLLEPEGLWNGEHTIVTSRFGEVRGLDVETEPNSLAAQETIIEGLGVFTGPPGAVMSVSNIRNSLIAHLNSALENARARVRAHRAVAGTASDPNGVDDPIYFRPGDDTSLGIFRDGSIEATASRSEMLAAWYLIFPDGTRHYLWLVNPLASRAIRRSVSCPDPPEVICNDLTVQRVWGDKHPLFTETDPTTGEDLVKVVRPRTGVL